MVFGNNKLCYMIIYYIFTSWDEGRKQIEEKGYAKPYDGEGRAVTSAVVVVDAEKHTALVCL